MSELSRFAAAWGLTDENCDVAAVLLRGGERSVRGFVADLRAALAPVSSSGEAESGHALTEYGTTTCPVEHVRADVDDDGKCEACGARVTPAPVPSGGQADDLDADLTDVGREAQRLGRCGTLRYGGPCWLMPGHKGPHHCYREDVDALLAARPVLSVGQADGALLAAIVDGPKNGEECPLCNGDDDSQCLYHRGYNDAFPAAARPVLSREALVKAWDEGFIARLGDTPRYKSRAEWGNPYRVERGESR